MLLLSSTKHCTVHSPSAGYLSQEDNVSTRPWAIAAGHLTGTTEEEQDTDFASLEELEFT